jgi:endonuclease YncB( thermonuclease family)
MMDDYEPREDKSTSSTLTVTLIFMVVLVIMAWALKRNAADRAVPGAPAPLGAGEARGSGGSAGPSIPLDGNQQPRFDYQVIDRCQLEDDPANDGDTFRVLTPQGSFLFRLYWVQAVQVSGDTPESSRDAMEHFHLRTEAELRDLAVQARDFTLNTLRGVPFRLVTRWEREPGGEAYYCFAYAAESAAAGAAQHNLALLLVKNGLALIRPSKYPLPNSPATKPGDFHNDLLAAQEEAARTHTGGWAQHP